MCLIVKRAILQPTNGDSARGVAKSLVWKFFQDGETKEEFICQLCPKHKVIRTKHGGTSNLLRHVRRIHPRSFIDEQSKQVLREKLKMKMEDTNSSTVRGAIGRRVESSSSSLIKPDIFKIVGSY